MGEWCSACAPDELPLPAESDYAPTIRPPKDKATLISGSDGSTTDGYDASTSRDDSKSASSKATDDHELEVAYDGWRKAIEAGNETLATFYVQHQYPDIDFFEYRWDNGDSSLHVACKNKKARLVFFLLTQGAAVNYQNMYTLNTSLHHAVASRDEKIIDLLLKWDADPNVMNKDKESAITASAYFQDQSIYKMLAAANEAANPNPHFIRVKTNEDRFVALQRSLDVHALANDVLSIVPEVSEEQQQMAESNAKINVESDSEKELITNNLVGRNPFTPLGRRPTPMRTECVKKHLKQKPLPKLQAWLEKRKPGTVVPTYQKRWIIVKGAHILWSSKQREIVNDADRKERKKFNGYIHLTTIEEIRVVETRNNTKFMVKAKDAKKGNMRDYIFRCPNKRDRDYWVAGLKEHKKQYQVIMRYLAK